MTIRHTLRRTADVEVAVRGLIFRNPDTAWTLRAICAAIDAAYSTVRLVVFRGEECGLWVRLDECRNGARLWRALDFCDVDGVAVDGRTARAGADEHDEPEHEPDEVQP